MGDASKFTFIVVERRCFPSDVYFLHEIEKERRERLDVLGKQTQI